MAAEHRRFDSPAIRPANSLPAEFLDGRKPAYYIRLGEYIMQTKRSQAVNRTFRAVADPTRLRILNLLRGKERCVCELVEALRIPQPKASRHLAYLRRVGLVSVRKQGLWKYYRLAAAGNTFHAKLLECLASCSGDVPVMQHDLRRMQRSTACCE